MTTPLKAIDDKLDPLLQAANKVRQVRDALPAPMWQLVPAALRLPMDELFRCVEGWDRFVGQMKRVGESAAEEEGRRAASLQRLAVATAEEKKMTVEYRVREIKRYVVTRFQNDPNGTGGISTKGEYENFDVAYEVGYALCKAEHDAAGTPPDDMGFIYPSRTQPALKATPIEGYSMGN